MDGPKGARFLYGDTDSIIFLQKKNNPAMNPGRYLGEMKDEYPGHEILVRNHRSPTVSLCHSFRSTSAAVTSSMA